MKASLGWVFLMAMLRSGMMDTLLGRNSNWAMRVAGMSHIVLVIWYYGGFLKRWRPMRSRWQVVLEIIVVEI